MEPTRILRSLQEAHAMLALCLVAADFEPDPEFEFVLLCVVDDSRSC